MELKKYKLGEILDVTRGASLSGEFYATEGKCIRLTCGNFDYQNNCFKENKSKDNLYYIGDFKPEFLMEEGDIITPLTEQAALPPLSPKAVNIFKVKMWQRLFVKKNC